MTSVLLGPKGKILVGLWEREEMAAHIPCRRDRISGAEGKQERRAWWRKGEKRAKVEEGDGVLEDGVLEDGVWS